MHEESGRDSGASAKAEKAGQNQEVIYRRIGGIRVFKD